MPSPFPGMNPYLEHPAMWPDVHLALIPALRAAWAAKVSPRYYVAIEERTYPIATDPESFLGRPGVVVVRSGRPAGALSRGASAAGVIERPVAVDLPVPDEVHERFLEVRDTQTRKVITVIEILSPSNKFPGEGRAQYERKRQEVLGSLTNLMEFDLLRGGDPMPMGRLPESDYRILVSREWERYRGQLYPFNVREAIPEIPIPLSRHEQEPLLSLGMLLNQVYDQARYDLRVDYAVPPQPPLKPEDAAWCEEVLAKARLR
ncbi:MAG: DUF4058 family protein [Planctomycetes bacterium]|nr:DUF4058 family protein [Planctomycetota bacterium]